METLFSPLGNVNTHLSPVYRAPMKKQRTIRPTLLSRGEVLFIGTMSNPKIATPLKSLMSACLLLACSCIDRFSPTPVNLTKSIYSTQPPKTKRLCRVMVELHTVGWKVQE